MADVLGFDPGTSILPPDEEDTTDLEAVLAGGAEGEEPVVRVVVGGTEAHLPIGMSRAAVCAVRALREGYALSPTDELLTPNRAAAMLGVSRTMVTRWSEEGRLEDQPVGTHHKIPLRSVRRLLEARRRAGRRALADAKDPAHADRVAAAAEQLDALRSPGS